MSKKAILITGASGFIGTWLADEVFRAGYELIGIDVHAPKRPDIWSKFATALCETADLEELTTSYSLFAVCHLAGGASVTSSIQNPYGDFSSLLPGTAKVLLFLAHKHAQARIFIFSSAAVYGNPVLMPITETTNVLPISPYGIHKLLAEDLAYHYTQIYGLRITVFRVFSVYGPGLRKQLIWDVSLKAIKAAIEKQKVITLFGTGRESRDFIYIEDLCKAFLCVLKIPQENKFDIFNIASGVESTIEEVATSIVNKIDTSIKVNFDGVTRSGDPLNWNVDISKLKATSFTHTNSLQRGLQQVVNWIKYSFNDLP